MNLFRTTCIYYLLTAFLAVFLWAGIFCTPAVSGQDLEPTLLSDSEGPMHQHNSFLFADIDTLKQQVYLFIESGLWKFDLKNKQWQFLDSLKNRPNDIEHYEFGFNAPKQKLQLWSHGVGRMYDISLSDYSIERIDNSHNHRNQFGHAPFFHKNGALFAFGGYGYWNWKNIITFYNETINEWNIQPVRPSSDLPAPRKPLSGTYSPANEKFYLLGGNHPEKGRQDDQYTGINLNYDYWTFDFNNQRWEYITIYDWPNFTFYNPQELKQFSKINQISNSAYSTASKFWYLPFWRKTQSKDVIYLKSINVKTGQEAKPILINFGLSREFLPVNFLYNNSEKLLFVGLDYLSHTSTYPIRIYTLVEDQILNAIIPQETPYTWLWIIIAIILLFIILVIGYIFIKNQSGGAIRIENDPVLEDLGRYEWLNESEKNLIHFLQISDAFKQTHEIEEFLWPNVKNYDYRRRMRNDIIKSINKKMRQHLDLEEQLIINKTDPNDRRKKLYGINPDIK